MRFEEAGAGTAKGPQTRAASVAVGLGAGKPDHYQSLKATEGASKGPALPAGMSKGPMPRAPLGSAQSSMGLAPPKSGGATGRALSPRGHHGPSGRAPLSPRGLGTAQSSMGLTPAGRGSGMSQDAVYLAWGKPHSVAKGGAGNSTTERWIYTGQTAVWSNQFDMGYGGGYGAPAPYGYAPQAPQAPVAPVAK